MSTTTWLPTNWIRPWYFSSELPESTPTPAEDPGPQLVPEPPEDKSRFPLWAAALTLAFGAAIGAALWSASETAGERSQATAGSAETIKVERAKFAKTVRISGTIGAKNFAMIKAPRMRGSRDRGRGGGSPGGGLTIATLAEAGTMIEKGDVVAEFESKRTADILDDYESNLAQTRSLVGTRQGAIMIVTETLRQEFRTAKAEAGKAALDLRTAEVRSDIEAEILRLLSEEGAVTTEQLEQQVRLQELADAAELRSLELDVRQQEKKLDRTKFDFEKMKLRSPVSGLVVIETVFQRGTFAQAAAGDEVRAGSYFMRVVDLTKMAVYANLNQVDSQMVQIGSPVRVQLDAYPDVTFEGKVASVGAMAKSGGGGGRRGPPGSSGSRGQWVKQVAVEIDILSEDERISPDLSASADIIVEQLEDALVVPRAAVEFRGDDHFVWLRDGQLFAEREVQLGSVSDTHVVIVSGLSEGDEIATQPVATELASR